MDLCLHGSQINLAEREKPKPKYTSQIKLTLPCRPRSANFLQKRSRSSPFLWRPQSADPKFGRNSVSSSSLLSSDTISTLTALKHKRPTRKQLESLSSSNLYKLLLEEPIRRPWLCRSSTANSRHSNSNENTNNARQGAKGAVSGDTSSPDEQYESGTSRKSEGDSSNLSPGKSTASNTRTNNSKSSCTYVRMSSAGSLTTTSRDQNNYWRPGSANLYSGAGTGAGKLPKPDLPGRVSFSKPSMATDFDSSDCDNNDKQEPFCLAHVHDACKGMDMAPMTLNNTAYEAKCAFGKPDSRSELSSAGYKKSVHFGATTDEEVLAQTYEYPKCPSENCSCSTRSSSSCTALDALDSSKCASNARTCRFALELGRDGLNDLRLPELEASEKAPVEDCRAIRQYKSVVGEDLKNSTLKGLLDDNGTGGGSGPLYSSEKPNNLVKTNLGLVEFSKSRDREASNNFDIHAPTKAVSLTSNSESVINNYLKAASSPTPAPTSASTMPNLVRKRENTAKSSLGHGHTHGHSHGHNSLPRIANNLRRSKLSGLGARTLAERVKLKKAISFGSLQEDNNLNEFQLDKVDSWMSIHGEAFTSRKNMTKHGSLDDNFGKLTKQSLDFLLDDHNAGDDEDDDGEGEGDGENGGGGESRSQSSAKSNDMSEEDTYDEIVSVIKEIDEDKKKDNYAEHVIPELDFQMSPKSEGVESTTQTGKSVEGLLQPSSQSQESPDKYKDILNYLDNVEDSCEKTLLETRRSMPDTNRTEIEFIVEPDIAEDVPKLAELLMLPNHQLARRVIVLSLRANELANAVHLAKEHLSKTRVERQKGVRQERANAASKLRDQKKHYEGIVKRHQTFIEQLLKDKGTLCEKLAALTRRLESQNQAWEHKLETELARVKETTMAGEKIRRERWVRENTKRIKELTVKGLEAEINKMTCNQQREIAELKRQHQQQLLDTLEDARLKHEQAENAVREACAQDRETIIEKERTAIRERFERQLEEERKSFDEQKQKLVDEFAAERERLHHELKLKEAEFQTRRADALREKEAEYEETIADLQEKMSKQEEKYQNRVQTIEKQFEVDFDIWKKEYKNACKIEQAEKENAIRQHYRAERDRQIDEIVSRMDDESLKQAEEFEAKISRMRDKYEKDLRDLEEIEQSVREKYTETRAKLAESDAQVRNAEAEMKQLQIELDHSKKMCNDFLNERDQMRENLRNELQAEVNAIKQERDHEIQKIHKRVQQAIEKKDATIEILQKENGGLRERCLKLEAVIRQQRKDYCVK